MGIPSSINIVQTKHLQLKLTAFFQSPRKSLSEVELHQHRSQAALAA